MSLFADIFRILVLFLLLLVVGSADRKDVILEIYVDIFLGKARKLGLQNIIAVLLHYVCLESGKGFLQIAVIKECGEHLIELIKRISPEVVVSCKDCRCKHIKYLLNYWFKYYFQRTYRWF